MDRRMDSNFSVLMVIGDGGKGQSQTLEGNEKRTYRQFCLEGEI